MVQELKWVHDMIRADLRRVRDLAAAVTAGLPAGEVRAGIESLATNGPLWQLKVNCLHHCRFVHGHHSLESAILFPELRRSNPALNPVVDKLEADHASIATLLEEIEAADDREALVALLDRLSDDLLAHLAYEEEHISDTLRTWQRWPFM
jgi:hypothetical protein